MGRQKKAKVVPIDTANVTPASVAAEIYPPGVPLAPDGTVAAEASVSLAQIRKAGAATPGAAAANTRKAKIIARKQNGETHVSWGTDDAIELFDMITEAFPSSGLYAQITQLESGMQYPPVRLQGFPNSPAFYDHLLRNVHRSSGPAKYEVAYKDVNSKLFRGKGHVLMPSTLEDPSFNRGNNMNQAPPPYYGQQPPSQGYAPLPAQAYPPQPYAPYPPPQQAAPQPPTPAPAPTPPPVQQQPQYQPAPPQQFNLNDPAYAGPLGQILLEIRNLQGQNQQTALQAAAALGALEEFKRLEATRAMYPQQPSAQPQMQQPPPPPPQGVGAPWASPVQQPQYQQPVYQQPQPPQQQFVQATDQFGRPVVDSTGRPIFIPVPQQQQQQYQQPRGFAGPPPPAPTTAAAASPPQDFAAMANNVSTMMRSLDMIRTAVGGGNPIVGDEEEDDAAAAAALVRPDDPFITTKLGFGEEPPVLVTNKDGSINTLGTVMGNLSQIPGILNKVASGIAAVNQQTQRMQHGRPITAQGHVVEHRQQLPPPPPPPPPQQQGVSFMPNLDSFGQ